jgi:transposase
MPSKAKTTRREHSAEKVAIILNMHSLGYSASKISVETDIPKSTVTRITRRANLHPDKSFEPTKRSGRPSKLTKRAERALLRHVAKYPSDTITALSTPSKSGYRLHPNTTRRYLQKNEIYAFRPRRKPFLTNKHKRARLKWAKEYIKWTAEDWACVAFSDECTMEIGLDVTPPWVRRPKGKAYKSQYLKPTFKSGRSSIGVWGSISLNLKKNIVVLPSNVRINSAIYCNTILNDYAYPFYEAIAEKHGDALWQDDGAKYHTSKQVVQWQESMKMQRMIWPVQSPDLNPIENIWQILKYRICKRRHRIQSIQEMRIVVQDE